MNKRIEELSQIIQDSQKEIASIRKECPHTTTYEGIWEWAVGHQIPAHICCECGGYVKELYVPKMIITTPTQKQVKESNKQKFGYPDNWGQLTTSEQLAWERLNLHPPPADH